MVRLELERHCLLERWQDSQDRGQLGAMFRTGSRAFTSLLAIPLGLDYAIMSGGDVGPLGKDAVGWAGCKVVDCAMHFPVMDKDGE